MNQRTTAHRSVHAGAVGHGIAFAIYASAETRRTPEDAVHFCLTAAEEAGAAVKESPPMQREGSAARMLRELAEPGDPEYGAPPMVDEDDLRAAMREAGAAAFRACMPELTGRRNVQAYIACVASGLQHGYFGGPEAKAMLHTAQLALQAWPRRQQTRGRKQESR